MNKSYPKPFNGFDLLAPVYDSLAMLIYGKSIQRAQACFLNKIAPRSKVLILGGGTGWLLAELVARNPECEVWYVDSSANMLTRARKRVTGPNIHFVMGTIDEISPACMDVVITDFFLDLFSDSLLPALLQSVALVTKPATLWLVADFVDHGKLWQRVLLRAMYWFFRLVCGIEAEKLPAWEKCLENLGWHCTASCQFYGGFIEGKAYRLSAP